MAKPLEVQWGPAEILSEETEVSHLQVNTENKVVFILRIWELICLYLTPQFQAQAMT